MHEGKHMGVMTTFKKPTAERLPARGGGGRAARRQRVGRPAAGSRGPPGRVVPSGVPAARPATAPAPRRRVGQRVATGPDRPRRLTQVAWGALSGAGSGRLAAGSRPGGLAGTRARWGAAPGGAGSLGRTVASVAGGAVEKAVVE